MRVHRARVTGAVIATVALVAASAPGVATAWPGAPGAARPASVSSEDPADPLGPIPPGSVPEIPATGVATDAVVVLIDGVPVPATRDAEPNDTLVSVNYGEGAEVYLGAGRRSGPGIVRLGGDAVLRLPPGGTIFHTGPEGAFLPNSTIRFYLFGPAEVDLGSGRSDDLGSGDSDGVRIPEDIPPGTYTLQVVGRDGSGRGRVRVITTGARLRVDQRPTTAISWPRRFANPGTTRLLRTPVITNAGKTAKVRYHCTVIDTSIRKPGLCRFSIDDQGWLRVTLNGSTGVWIWLDLSAPGAPGYSRYSGGRILSAPLSRR